MEDTLRDVTRARLVFTFNVLILVLMEDTLRDMGENEKACLKAVLILVLMEDTLRDNEANDVVRARIGLNPCFNGRYSQSTPRLHL